MLSATALQKRFGDLIAVAGVDLEVPAGTIFGFLGPNGAGKTTTISMLCGLLKPDAGRVVIDGHDLAKDELKAKARMGVVPQEIALYLDLSARENLAFWGGLYGLRGAQLDRRLDEVLDMVGLEDRSREAVDNFSGGMKRRLNLAAGLLHEPGLLLLDEPTVGIDPQARHKILDVVKEVAAAGTAVIYTTHYLEEAEDLCDALAIIDEGKILAQGKLEDLRGSFGEGTLLRISGDFGPAQLSDVANRLPALRLLQADEGQGLLMIEGAVGPALQGLYDSDFPMQDIQLREPGLEDLFLKLTGRALRD